MIGKTEKKEHSAQEIHETSIETTLSMKNLPDVDITCKSRTFYEQNAFTKIRENNTPKHHFSEDSVFSERRTLVQNTTKNTESAIKNEQATRNSVFFYIETPDIKTEKKSKPEESSLLKKDDTKKTSNKADTSVDTLFDVQYSQYFDKKSDINDSHYKVASIRTAYVDMNNHNTLSRNDKSEIKSTNVSQNPLYYNLESLSKLEIDEKDNCYTICTEPKKSEFHQKNKYFEWVRIIETNKGLENDFMGKSVAFTSDWPQNFTKKQEIDSIKNYNDDEIVIEIGNKTPVQTSSYKEISQSTLNINLSEEHYNLFGGIRQYWKILFLAQKDSSGYVVIDTLDTSTNINYLDNAKDNKNYSMLEKTSISIPHDFCQKKPVLDQNNNTKIDNFVSNNGYRTTNSLSLPVSTDACTCIEKTENSNIMTNHLNSATIVRDESYRNLAVLSSLHQQQDHTIIEIPNQIKEASRRTQKNFEMAITMFERNIEQSPKDINIPSSCLNIFLVISIVILLVINFFFRCIFISHSSLLYNNFRNFYYNFNFFCNNRRKEFTKNF
ncbi:hypothetical protein EDEG_02969 [Edhazardia aedis USNM 41457]|uniref:Uncharacterized protein n=1 Tax=Edhazardia aedis (strain USNM 41457) TaxID=1003232 RepID=J9D545_EDHAE|nr:hypothetical protein EDEG_02969 [Edhazardia aedis USNM 41457]|eukprot:EJW02649.1 hypothetical protein EDEG_02969 [Edhazardia aedis USNM 41457]